MKTFKEQPIEIRKIIYNLACEFRFGDYSSIDEIDYKFWEDVPGKWIAIALAEKIVELENKIEQLQK